MKKVMGIVIAALLAICIGSSLMELRRALRDRDRGVGAGDAAR